MIMANTNVASSSGYQVIQKEKENGLRGFLLQDLGNERLRNEFHQKFPKNPVDLYKELMKHQKKLYDHLKKKIIYQDQYDLLLPSNGQTLSNEFDITLLFYLLRTFCNYKQPSTGWNQNPTSTDQSKEAHCLRIKNLRNIKQHKGALEMTDQELLTYKSEISVPLLGLGCQQNDITNALTCVIDNTVEIRYNKEKARADLEKIRADQAEVDAKSEKTRADNAEAESVDEKTRADQEKERADNAEIKVRDETHRADKLEACKENVTQHLLPTLPTFIGRDKEMLNLHTMLLNSSDNQIGTVICGMGGVGKSELARAYANENKEYYKNNIMWINGETESSIEKSFLDIAQFVGLNIHIKFVNESKDEFVSNEVMIQKVYRFFKNQNPLFVFDNVNNKNNIDKYLPQCNSGKKRPTLLITSQYLQWGSYFNILPLEVFSKDIASEFLTSNEKHQQSDQREIDELCHLLGYHPLALQHAISYADVNTCSYSEYASLFMKYPKRLTEESPVFTTFQIALNNIMYHNTNDTILHQLIKFIPFLDGKEIRKDFLLQLYDQDVIGVNKALATLQNFSLINIRDQNKSNKEIVITIHSLVQKAILFTENEVKESDNSLRDLLILISTTESSPRFGSFSSKHLTHIYNNELTKDAALQILKDETEIVVIPLLDVLQYNYNFKELLLIGEALNCCTNPQYQEKITNYILVTYMSSGQYKQALELYKMNESEIIELLGDEYPDLLQTQNNMAKCYRNMGQYDKALNTYKMVESKRKKLLGDEHPDLLVTQNDMAKCYQEMGQYEKALNIYNVVESKRLTLLGDNHSDLLETHSGMAICYQDMGLYEKALNIHKMVESKKVKLLGDDHPCLLTIQNNMANCYHKMGKFEKALDLYKMVEIRNIKLFGEEHPDLLTTQNNMANCYQNMGQYERALDIYKMVETRNINLYGNKHPVLLTTQNNMALCYRDMGQYEKALNIYKIVESKRITLLGHNHPDLLKTQSGMADCYQEMGQYEKALNIYKVVESKGINFFGDEHPDLLETQISIANCYQQMGQYKKAINIHKMVEPKIINLLGDEHPLLIGTQNGSAHCYHQMGQYEKALNIYKMLESKIIILFGAEYPDLLAIQNNMANCYLAMGQYENVLSIYKVVELKRIKLLGDEHPALLRTQNDMANCYQEMGQHETALNIYKDVESKTIKRLGDEHPDLLGTQHSMAICYHQMGQYEIALNIYKMVESKGVKILGDEHPNVIRFKRNMAICRYNLYEEKRRSFLS